MLCKPKFKDIVNDPHWSDYVKEFGDPVPKQYENYLGIYTERSFNPELFLESYVRIQRGERHYDLIYPNFSEVSDENWFNSYGVCDSPEQLIANLPDEVLYGSRLFAVFLTPIRKNEQEDGGWRWHKWGPYIGTQTPTCEYLYDEPLIEEVYVYHVQEFLPDEVLYPEKVV